MTSAGTSTRAGSALSVRHAMVMSSIGMKQAAGGALVPTAGREAPRLIGVGGLLGPRSGPSDGSDDVMTSHSPGCRLDLRTSRRREPVADEVEETPAGVEGIGGPVEAVVPDGHDRRLRRHEGRPR